MLAVYSSEKPNKVADSLLVSGLIVKVPRATKTVVPTHPAVACRAVSKKCNGNYVINVSPDDRDPEKGGSCVPGS